MPTFIDESGDTGRGSGSLPFFRLAAVWVPCLAVADGFREAVGRMRSRFGLKAAHEFKFGWTHGKPEHREAFFGAALDTDFRFAACAIDKTAGDWRSADARAIHWACAVALASSLRATYQAAEAILPPRNGRPRFLHELVIVDDNQDGAFLAALDRALGGLRSAQSPDVPLVGKVKFGGSGPDVMIQLADMVCGAVGAHITGDGMWYRMIESRCVGLTYLP
jgi:hypothetical protein